MGCVWGLEGVPMWNVQSDGSDFNNSRVSKRNCPILSKQDPLRMIINFY